MSERADPAEQGSAGVLGAGVNSSALPVRGWRRWADGGEWSDQTRPSRNAAVARPPTWRSEIDRSRSDDVQMILDPLRHDFPEKSRTQMIEMDSVGKQNAFNAGLT
jgi:hypothetical protein